MSEVAVGFRAHSGWAAMVAVAGPPVEPAVLERRRIELAESGPRQPFHAAEGLNLERAERLIRRSSDTARSLARRALRDVLAELTHAGHEVVACGLLMASSRPLPGLAQVLASHALIHAAEGELFREALLGAAHVCGLRTHGVKEKELMGLASVAIGMGAEDLRHRLNRMGRTLGPPWRQDEKLATLVAWLSLTRLHPSRT